MKTKPMPLSDRGTTGLLQFIAAGPDSMFSARKARAMKVIESRTADKDAHFLFSEVANDERADRNGWSKPILSPLKRLDAAKAGDRTAFYHA